MSEHKLIVLYVSTAQAHMSKALKHIDDAIDLMKAKENAEIHQFELEFNELTDMADKVGKELLSRQV